LQLLEHEGHGLAVKVPRGRRHRRVDVGVRVDPDETQVRTLPGVASHRANGKALGGEGQACETSAASVELRGREHLRGGALP